MCDNSFEENQVNKKEEYAAKLECYHSWTEMKRPTKNNHMELENNRIKHSAKVLLHLREFQIYRKMHKKG